MGRVLELAVIVFVFVVYGLFSRRLEKRITGPMVFMTVGVLISAPFLGWFTLDLRSTTIQILLNGALALVLFTEAASLGAHRIDGAGLSSRLLLVALPLMMIGGLAVALVLFDMLSFWEAAVVAVLLSPTDASLGLPIIKNERVPLRIRSGLVIEGGLNDGLAVPFAIFAAGAAEVTTGEGPAPELMKLILTEVGLAVIVGVVAGWGGARAIDLALSRSWATKHWIDITLLAMAALTFVLAQGLHASGFIAAWVAGLVLGKVAHSEALGHRRFAENESSLLVMLALLTFGALSVGPLIGELSIRVVLYGVLSLAVVRPVAVALSLTGGSENVRTMGFLGWFGPRGLPSLVLALILVFEDFSFPSGSVMAQIIVFTVALSVYAHGLTAAPLGNRYAKWADGDAAQPIRT